MTKPICCASQTAEPRHNWEPRIRNIERGGFSQLQFVLGTDVVFGLSLVNKEIKSAMKRLPPDTR